VLISNFAANYLKQVLPVSRLKFCTQLCACRPLAVNMPIIGIRLIDISLHKRFELG